MAQNKNWLWAVPAVFIICLVSASLLVKNIYSTRTPNNLYIPNQWDGISCDDSIKKLNDVRLHQLIKSNRINVRNLDELLGGNVDNQFTQLKEQINIFLRQIDCAENELKLRGKL